MPDFAEIANAVAEEFEVPAVKLRGFSRERKYTRPRMMAYSLCRDLCEASFPEIATFFNRDHTTVIYGTTEHKKRMRESTYREQFERIKRAVGPIQYIRNRDALVFKSKRGQKNAN